MRSRMVLVAIAIAACAGCTLGKPDLGREGYQTIGTEGRVLLPKRCDLTLQTVKAALGEPGVDEAVWRAADEDIVDEEARRALEANGLRFGVITGTLPAELEALVNAPPPNQVDRVDVIRGEGEPTLVRTTPEPEGTSETTLLISRQGRAGGKAYQDLRGHFRITTTQEGADGVALRVVPELHHGAYQRRFSAEAPADPNVPQQFLMKDGQQEDTLRELAATIVLHPGQVAVLGCRSDRPSSLGHVLMTESERGSDRVSQKVLIIAARRAQGTGFGAEGEAVPKVVPSPPALQPLDADEMPTRSR